MGAGGHGLAHVLGQIECAAIARGDKRRLMALAVQEAVRRARELPEAAPRNDECEYSFEGRGD
eukprot:2003418-Alexandrium_andersonii.AAC.1